MEIVLVAVVLPFLALCAVVISIGLIAVGPQSLAQGLAAAFLLLGAVIFSAWGLLRYDVHASAGVLAGAGAALCLVGLRWTATQADRRR